jgi:hypothetical protein
MASTGLSRRIRTLVLGAPLIAALIGVQPALAARPQPFCPTPFTAGSVGTLAEILSGFLTFAQVRAFDKDSNGSLCWLHIPGVGYVILDDATPR